MIYTNKTKQAMRISYEAHKGQYDRGGIPYVFHPFSVANKMDDEESTILALLHDVIEDTDTTISDLRSEGISESILEALQLLTKGKSEDYFHYIDRLKNNPLAIKVKLADLEHNSKTSRLSSVGIADKNRLEKYKKARKILLTELESLQ
nr:hypothetical protein [uncultured bacterium]